MKTALITGVSGAIGSKIAKKFLSEGYLVFGTYNQNQKSIDKFKSELGQNELNLFCAVKTDLSNEKDIENLAKIVFSNVKHVDVLVNNAGVDLIKCITETSLEEWQNIFSVNVNSVFSLTNKILPSMIDTRKGKIINISSVWGVVGASCEVAYSASKSAIIGYSKALAKEVAPSNITVNCVCPGVIDSPMNDCFTEEEKRDIISQIPLGRMGNAEEVASLVYFLADVTGNYITGQSIVLDGGYIL